MKDAVVEQAPDLAGLMAESVAYVRSHFLTLDLLADRTGVASEVIAGYIEHRCIPWHSYSITTDISISSFFGPAAGRPVEVWYYASSHIHWIEETLGRYGTRPLRRIAEERGRWFHREYRAEAERIAPDLIPRGQLEVLVESEFERWLDGTYRLCTLTAEPADIARKDLGIARIRALTDDGAKPHLTAEERELLRAAVTMVDLATSSFAPHERARSSREKWIHQISRRYLGPPRPAGAGPIQP